MPDSRLDPDSPRAKWVAELRSGAHAQGSGRLDTVNDSGEHRYCCLGVACIVAEQHGVLVSRGAENVTGHVRLVGDMLVDSAVQNGDTARWLGLNALGDTACAHMNDAEQLSFAEIADRLGSPAADAWFEAPTL